MTFEYVIPTRLDPADMRKPARFRQLPDRYLVPHITIGCTVYSDTMDILQQKPSPSGTGGRSVYLYNFTDTPICMIDSKNGIVIVEPFVYAGSQDISDWQGTIVVEVMYNNQDSRLSESSLIYLNQRRYALVGLDLGVPSENLYNDVNDFDNIFTKANENQRHRFVIDNAVSVLNKNGGAFYIEDVDVIIGSTLDKAKIWIHPKSDKNALARARPREPNISALGIDISINDIQHLYDKAFVNLASSVIEIPVTRDPSRVEGVTVWYNVHDPGSSPQIYSFADCPLKIFTNKTDAQSVGSPEKILEKEILKEKNNFQREKFDYDKWEALKQKEENDRKRAHQREQEAQHKRERERQWEQQQQQQKNNEKFERISFWRKMLLEGTKAVVAAATTAALIFGWYVKQKKTE